MRSDHHTLIASVLVVSLMALPQALLAQEKRGANLVVALKDGSAVSGELIAVKQDSLVLLNPVGKDESVAVGDISKITISKKSKAGTGFLAGFIIGGVAGGILGAKGEDPTVGRAGAVFLGALAFGAVGGLVGLGIGAASSGDETIDFTGMNEAEAKLELNRFRGMARIGSAQ